MRRLIGRFGTTVARRGMLALAAALLTLTFTLPAGAEKRVALVVGNGDYAHATRLPNPPNDAEDMAAALRALGFEVISATNVDKSGFDAKLRDFAKALREARMALFFYAGHGMQVAGKNYAIPLDARLESAADLPVETVDIDRVLAVMQADDSRVNLVFLDACRDNPLTRSFARTLPATRSTSVGTGLSAVEAGRGTLIAYATAPNRVAIDGRGRNSPFTAALLRHIHTPGLDIALVMRRVTAEVEAASGGAQVPWVHASLTTDVVLKAGDGPAPPPAPAIASVSPNALPAPAAPKIDAPNEPLPADVPVDPEVLKIVETHPFFANAPPVMARFYRIDSIINWTTSGTPGTTTSSQSYDVTWLRRGIVKFAQNDKGAVRHSGCRPSCPSTSRWTSVYAANGLIQLFSKGGITGSGVTNNGTYKLTKLDKLKGRIFPVGLGNSFSYETTLESVSTSTASRGSRKEITVGQTNCEYTQRYEARRFHADLTGNAYILSCQGRWFDNNVPRKEPTQSKEIFFESLGLWIGADPDSPRERIVYGDTNTADMQATGTYTLKSFTLVR
jgi:hypothetical protein